MSNLTILPIWVSRGHFNFAKPDRTISPKRDTCWDITRCWQRKVTDLACGAKTSYLSCCSTGLIVLVFCKPEITIRSFCDAAKDQMRQRELMNLALWCNHSNRTWPIIRTYFGKPEVAICSCGDTG